jgi:ABC-type polysaccharide/polyol phosphate export permease
VTAAAREEPVLELGGEATPVPRLAMDLWRSRGLLRILARKDFFVRYRRASLGMAWAVLVPLVQATVLAVVVSRFVHFRDVHVDYVVFVFSGTLVWNTFSTTVSAAATSIVDGAGLSTKIYFPRALLPLVTVASNLYGLVPSVGILLVLALATGAPLGPRLVLLLPALALTALLAAAFGLVLAALHVYFRDVRYIVQTALVAWFYATPVFYPLEAAGRLAPLLRANPATGMIELMRAATVGADPGFLTAVWWSLGWVAALVTLGAALHRRFDRVFVDLL